MPDPESDPPLDFDPGSFRDPLSRVLDDGERIVRVVRGAGVADLDALEAAPFWSAAQAEGSVVGTRRVDVPSALASQGWEAAVEHDRVPVVTYPYEWTFSMLQDAARQQLHLTRAALADRMLTKDATPYNTQFVGARPVFIDVGSFERLPAGEPWRAYRQFCELFYNPLLLQARRDIAFQPWLRGSLHGISPADCRALLRGRDRFRNGAFTNVVLHARFEQRNADSQRDVGSELQRAGFGPGLIDAQLRKLEKHVGALRWDLSSSTWSAYSDRGHYAAHDLEVKRRFVADVASTRTGRRVLDLGANDGEFSRLVADDAELVVAVDSDALVVDRLYRALRDEGDRTIVPLMMDLTDPSPALGWRNRERRPLIERVRPDLVLALAVVHHLAITGTVPLPAVAAMLRDHDAEVVVEFPYRSDPMVQRLLQRKRAGLFDGYDLEPFVAAVAERFTIVRREVLPSGTRELFHLRP